MSGYSQILLLPRSASQDSCDFIACLIHEEVLNQSHENMQALKVLKKVTGRLTCVLRMGGWNNIGQQFPYYRRTGKLWEYLLWRTLSGQIKYPPTSVSCLLQWLTKCARGKSGECGKHLVIFPKNILPHPTLFSLPQFMHQAFPESHVRFCYY